MNIGNRISEAEWEIMKIIWDNEPLKASQIVKKIQTRKSWNDKTIRTLIRRLVDKNILIAKKEKVNIYYPLVSKEKCIKDVTNSFLDRVFDGSIVAFMTTYINSNNISSEDNQLLIEVFNKNNNI